MAKKTCWGRNHYHVYKLWLYRVLHAEYLATSLINVF